LSAPVRFLALVVTGWAAVRAATLGIIPGFSVSYAKPLPERQSSAIVPTEFPPLPPVDASFVQPWPSQEQAYRQAPQQPRFAPVPAAYVLPYEYPAQPPIPPRPRWQLPSQTALQEPQFYTPIPTLDDWQVTPMPAMAFPERRSSPIPPVLTQAPAKPRLDRLQFTSWALLRGAPGPESLASGGTLGGSQAGARLTYAVNPWLAASLRTTSPVGGSRGAEVAAGVRVTPFRSIPIAITAERRQAISPHGGGRSAFALFVEGGLYRQPMPLNFDLDAYIQAGVVGLRSRDLFADGSFALTRPVWGRISAGLGVWGGVQPGLYRIDAGPRISIRLRDNIRAHIDWRQRLVGNAAPASGPSLTLAADF
jgi:hypothetical protein